MNWNFLSTASAASAEESVLDIEGAYFSEDELDNFGIDASIDGSMTADNSILQGSDMIRRGSLVSSERPKTSTFTKRSNPRLQARIDRLDLVEEESENRRNSTESLHVDAKRGNAQRSPGTSLTPAEARRPLSTRNSDSKTPQGRAAFSFDDDILQRRPDASTSGGDARSDADHSRSLYQPSRIFQSPRALPTSHVNTFDCDPMDHPQTSTENRQVPSVVPRRRSQVEHGTHRRDDYLDILPTLSSKSVALLESTSSDGVSVPHSFCGESMLPCEDHDDMMPSLVESRSQSSAIHSNSSPAGLDYCYSSSFESSLSTPRNEKEARVRAILAKSAHASSSIELNDCQKQLKITVWEGEKAAASDILPSPLSTCSSNLDSVARTTSLRQPPLPSPSGGVGEKPSVSSLARTGHSPKHSSVGLSQGEENPNHSTGIKEASPSSRLPRSLTAVERRDAVKQSPQCDPLSSPQPLRNSSLSVALETSGEAKSSAIQNATEQGISVLGKRDDEDQIVLNTNTGDVRSHCESHIRHRQDVDPYEWAYAVWRKKGLMVSNASEKRQSYNATGVIPATQPPVEMQQTANGLPLRTALAARPADSDSKLKCFDNQNKTDLFVQSKKRATTNISSSTDRERYHNGLDSQRNKTLSITSDEGSANLETSHLQSAKKPGFANILQKWKTVSEDKPCSHFLSPHNSPVRPSRQSMIPLPSSEKNHVMEHPRRHSFYPGTAKAVAPDQPEREHRIVYDGSSTNSIPSESSNLGVDTNDETPVVQENVNPVDKILVSPTRQKIKKDRLDMFESPKAKDNCRNDGGSQLGRNCFREANRSRNMENVFPVDSASRNDEGVLQDIMSNLGTGPSTDLEQQVNSGSMAVAMSPPASPKRGNFVCNLASPSRQKLKQVRLEVFESPKASRDCAREKYFLSPKRQALSPSRRATFDVPIIKHECEMDNKYTSSNIPKVRREPLDQPKPKTPVRRSRTQPRRSMTPRRSMAGSVCSKNSIDSDAQSFERKKTVDLELMSPTRSKRASLTPTQKGATAAEKRTSDSRARVRAKIRMINAARMSMSEDLEGNTSNSQASIIKDVYKHRRLPGRKAATATSQLHMRRAVSAPRSRNDYKAYAMEFMKQMEPEDPSVNDHSSDPIELPMASNTPRRSSYLRRQSSHLLEERGTDEFRLREEPVNRESRSRAEARDLEHGHSRDQPLDLDETGNRIRSLENAAMVSFSNEGPVQQQPALTDASPVPRVPAAQDSPWTSELVENLAMVQTKSRPVASPATDAYGDRPWRKDMMVRQVDAVGDQLLACADERECTCSNAVFAGNDELIEFFLPLMGMVCTCGRKPKGLINREEPTSLCNILRPWQVAFLSEFGIQRGDQLVKAHHRSSTALATALRQYRKKKGMTPFRTKSCGMALAIWSKTSKAFVRSIRKQLETGNTNDFLKLPNTLYILSAFLEKIPVPEAEANQLKSPNQHLESGKNGFLNQGGRIV